MPALRRSDLGSFPAGNAGDASIGLVHDGEFRYEHVFGDTVVGGEMAASDEVVIGGRWWHPA